MEWFLAVLAIAILLLTHWNGSLSTNVHHTDQELRLASILNRIEGVGRVEVMISGESEEAGVLIVAEGANDAVACLRLEYAVQTLLGTEISRIEIVPYQN